jgi:transposase
MDLRKWCKVIDVNEFRTSKLCCKCHNETEKVSYNGVKVNSVLRCCNNECGMIIDRDINGCKNILKMLMISLNKMDKPEAFKKTNKSLPSLDQKANVSAKVKTL